MTAVTPSLLIRRLSRGQLLAIDGLLAAAAALLCWFAATEIGESGWSEPEWASAVIGIALGLPVAFRRLWPVTGTAVVLVLTTAAVASGAIPFFAGPGPVTVIGLVLYTVGAEVGRRRSVGVAAVSVVIVAVVFGLASREAMGTGVVTWAVGACWATGRVVRERRAHAASRAEQATALAVEQERLRIARELHDIVAHSMSMIAVKATIADHVGDEHPEEMRDALRVIAKTSRETLGEIRRALGAVRAEAATKPAPELSDLSTLAEAARSTGLLVDLEVHAGEKLPADVALCVYRVVQEALTNVVRHARASRCRVEVVVSSGAASVRVADDGAQARAEPAESLGQGLMGMRERAAQFGGALTAGPAPDGGWLVAATLRYQA